MKKGWSLLLVAGLSGCGYDKEPELYPDDVLPETWSDELKPGLCLPGAVTKDALADAVAEISPEQLEAYWKDFVDVAVFPELEVAKDPTCKSPRCRMDELFGTDATVRILYLRHRHYTNASPYQANDLQHLGAPYDDSRARKAFTIGELDSLIRGLRAFPSFVRTKRFDFGATEQPQIAQRFGTVGRDIYANALMTYTDAWGALSPDEQVFVVIHEMGHRLESAAASSEAWRTLSRRDASGPHRERGFVSEYATTNYNEDWAESVLYYRLAPEKLRQVAPQKHAIIRQHVFFGQDFEGSADCSGGASYFDAGGPLAPRKAQPEELDSAAPACRYLFIQDVISGQTSLADLGACLRKVLFESQSERAIEELKIHPELVEPFRKSLEHHIDPRTGEAIYREAAKSFQTHPAKQVILNDFARACEKDQATAALLEQECSWITYVYGSMTDELFESAPDPFYVHRHSKEIDERCHQICEQKKSQTKSTTPPKP